MCIFKIKYRPDDTPWEGGVFKLSLNFTEDYPNKAPKVKFITKMFHPNSKYMYILQLLLLLLLLLLMLILKLYTCLVYNDGGICLDILQNQWSPIYDICSILTSIQSLLCDPNPNSPANS